MAAYTNKNRTIRQDMADMHPDKTPMSIKDRKLIDGLKSQLSEASVEDTNSFKTQMQSVNPADFRRRIADTALSELALAQRISNVH